MKLTILGSGTSTGIPLPGCDCEVCRSPNPKNSRLRTSAAITLPSGEVIVIDTTPDFRQQVLRADIRRLDAVLYTHAHADHILGLDDLRAYNYVQRRSVHCWATDDTLKHIKHIFNYVFGKAGESSRPLVDMHTLKHFEPLHLFGAEIIPFSLLHGHTEVTGFKIGDLAYATDCNQVPERSAQLLTSIKTLVLDGIRHEKHPTHFTIDEAIEFSRLVGAQRTILIHFTHSVEHGKVSASLPAGIELAYDGLEIEF